MRKAIGSNQSGQRRSRGAIITDDETIVFRPINDVDELDLFLQLSYVLDDELRDDLEAGRRRPGWMWVALRGEQVVARAAWWGSHDEPAPALLDVFDLDDADDHRLDVGVRLLTTAMAEVVPPGTVPPEYGRYVPADWRDDPTARQAVEDRMAAVARTGARLFVERLRLEWRPGTPIADPTGRLEFRPVRDSEEMIELMTLAIDGTLDAHSRLDLAQLSPAEAARAHYDGELALQQSPQSWWRVATLPDGEPVGFATPGRNHYNAVIGYLAVLPRHRGNGYIDEILADGTRVLAALDVPRIRAATDLDNVPMANAFARAGWVNYERALHMTWE